MFKAALKFALVLFIFHSNAQGSEDTFISVSGKIYSAKDSSVVSANVLYEKLPYYDDMGMALSRGESGFTVPLLQGTTYSFSIAKDGFKKFSQEIEVTGTESSGQTEAFYIEVDEIELIKLENLTFSTGSSTISGASYTELDELAQWMDENPTIVVQLEGHTDFRGNAQAQVNLSQARVDAVKEYLTKKGTKKSKNTYQSFWGNSTHLQGRYL